MMNSLQPPSRTRLSGFTLIEVLVVITVIAILVGILVPAVSSVKRKAKNAAAINEIAQLEQALRAYLADHNGPPTNDLGGRIERDFESRIIQLDARFGQLLMGQNINGDNAARIRYMEFKRFAPDGNPVNPWWTPGYRDYPQYGPFYVKFDIDFDGTIIKGRRGEPDDPPNDAVRGSVIVWTHNLSLEPDDPDFVVGSWKQ